MRGRSRWSRVDREVMGKKEPVAIVRIREPREDRDLVTARLHVGDREGRLESATSHVLHAREPHYRTGLYRLFAGRLTRGNVGVPPCLESIGRSPLPVLASERRSRERNFSAGWPASRPNLSSVLVAGDVRLPAVRRVLPRRAVRGWAGLGRGRTSRAQLPRRG